MAVLELVAGIACALLVIGLILKAMNTGFGDWKEAAATFIGIMIVGSVLIVVVGNIDYSGSPYGNPIEEPGEEEPDWIYIQSEDGCGTIEEAGDYQMNFSADGQMFSDDKCFQLTANNIRFSCAGNVIDGDGAGTAISITGDNVTVEDCNFTDLDVGIFTLGADNFTLRRNNYYDFVEDVASFGVYAISITEPHAYGRVQTSNFTGTDFNAISFDGDAPWIGVGIADNRIEIDDGVGEIGGIICDMCVAGSIVRNTIHSPNGMTAGIQVTSGAATLDIRNNNILRAENGLLVMESSEVVVYNNTISSAVSYGIYAWDIPDSYIQFNNISLAGVGLQMDYTDFVNVTDNIFSQLTIDGIQLYETTDSWFLRNTVSEAGRYGIYTIPVNGVGPSEDNTFTDNSVTASVTTDFMCGDNSLDQNVDGGGNICGTAHANCGWLVSCPGIP